MRTTLMLLVLGGGTLYGQPIPKGSAPAMPDARRALQDQIGNQSEGRIRMVGFENVSGPSPAPWDTDGEKRVLVSFRAEIVFTAPCTWRVLIDQEGASFKTVKPGELEPVPNRVIPISNSGERFLIQGQIEFKGTGGGWEPVKRTWTDPPQRLADTTTISPISNLPPDVPYPLEVLENRMLKLQLYSPDGQRGYYRGTRFDWSGLISRVEFAGHSFFSEFKREHDPLNHDDICGTAEEFGINAPAGYGQAGPGGLFLKVGIGLLERPDNEPYSFSRRYRIAQEGQWKITKALNKIEFRQDFDGSDGWAYSYTKTLAIDPHSPVLTIRRVLKNRGTRSIETDHYGHNFLTIDGLPAGPDYLVEYPFPIRLGEGSRPHEWVDVRDRSLVFLKELPAGESVWLRIEGFAGKHDNRISIRNRRSGAQMEITTDQPATRMAFFTQGGVLSPEPFVEIKVPPGATKTWNTIYAFSAGAKPSRTAQSIRDSR